MHYFVNIVRIQNGINNNEIRREYTSNGIQRYFKEIMKNILFGFYLIFFCLIFLYLSHFILRKHYNGINKELDEIIRKIEIEKNTNVIVFDREINNYKNKNVEDFRNLNENSKELYDNQNVFYFNKKVFSYIFFFNYI